MCWRNSPKANYKESTSYKKREKREETKQSHTNNKILNQGNLDHLDDNNNSSDTSQSCKLEMRKKKIYLSLYINVYCSASQSVVHVPPLVRERISRGTGQKIKLLKIVHISIKFIFEQTMVICLFWKSIVKDNENWLLVFQNSSRRGFLALGPNGKKK
jgi:hypothetical protein